MLPAFSVPFVIYWLIVKDFFYNVDVCDRNNEPGHCLSNSECSKIGTNIGSCDSESSDLICCKITFDYFNETYLLKQIFVRKSQTDIIQEMRIFSSGKPCGQSFVQYGNESILLKQKKKVYFNPNVHGSKTPDRIIFPIWTSYSRESRELGRQSSGTNYLYVIELNKLVADENEKSHPVSECLPESDTDDDFYMYLNFQKTFPIRKFFRPKMQKFNTMNLTIHDSSVIEEIDPEKRSRRSAHFSEDIREDLTCEKQQWEDILNIEGLKEDEDIQRALEVSYDIFHQIDNSEFDFKTPNDNTDCVINYVVKSKEASKEQMDENIHEQSSNKNEDKISPNESVKQLSNQIVDYNTRENVETERIVFKETTHDNKPVTSDEQHNLKEPVLE